MQEQPLLHVSSLAAPLASHTANAQPPAPLSAAGQGLTGYPVPQVQAVRRVWRGRMEMVQLQCALHVVQGRMLQVQDQASVLHVLLEQPLSLDQAAVLLSPQEATQPLLANTGMEMRMSDASQAHSAQEGRLHHRPVLFALLGSILPAGAMPQLTPNACHAQQDLISPTSPTLLHAPSAQNATQAVLWAKPALLLQTLCVQVCLDA